MSRSRKKKTLRLNLPQPGKEYALIMNTIAQEQIVIEYPTTDEDDIWSNNRTPVLQWHQSEEPVLSMPEGDAGWAEYEVQVSRKKVLRFDGQSFFCEDVIYVKALERKQTNEAEDEQISFSDFQP